MDGSRGVIRVSLSNPKTGSCSNTTSLWRLLVLPTLQTQPAAEVAKSLKFCQCEEAAVHESPYTKWSSVDHLDHLERSSRSYFNIISISQQDKQDMIIYDYYDNYYAYFFFTCIHEYHPWQSRSIYLCWHITNIGSVSRFWQTFGCQVECILSLCHPKLRTFEVHRIFVWVFWWICLQCPLSYNVTNS